MPARTWPWCPTARADRPAGCRAASWRWPRPRVRRWCRWAWPRGADAGSVGGAIAGAPVVEGLHQTYPSLPLVVTAVTPTGARVVTERFAGLASHRYFPLDFPGAVRRTLAAIDPAFFICMETELWPNALRALAARGVPTMIANGRLSDRSFRRYRLVRSALRGVLADVRVFAMRSDEDARRIIALGAPAERVVVTGNLKNDAPADPAGVADLWRRLLGLSRDQRVWIAGSTHGGEEEAALAAHAAAAAEHPGLALILTASGGALVVHDAASLGFELRRLLADPGLAAQRGEAGFESLAAQHGAVRQTLELVARFLAPESLARSGDAGR